MARSPRAPGVVLSGFRNWLINVKKRSEATADVYLSYLRGYLEKNDPKQNTTAAMVLAYESELSPTGAANFRKVWRHAVEFAKQVKGVELPNPQFPTRRTGTKTPHLIGDEVARLATKIQFPHLETLRWWDVKGTGNPDALAIQVSDTVIEVPRADVMAISAWAFSGGPVQRDAPLIPESPGSSRPMSSGRLRHIARIARDVMVQQGKLSGAGEMRFAGERI